MILSRTQARLSSGLLIGYISQSFPLGTPKGWAMRAKYADLSNAGALPICPHVVSVSIHR